MPRTTLRAAANIRRDIETILAHPGRIDTMAEQIHDLYLRAGWRPPTQAGQPPQRCREHTGTAMQNGRCPICGGTTATTTTTTTGA